MMVTSRPTYRTVESGAPRSVRRWVRGALHRLAGALVEFFEVEVRERFTTEPGEVGNRRHDALVADAQKVTDRTDVPPLVTFTWFTIVLSTPMEKQAGVATGGAGPLGMSHSIAAVNTPREGSSTSREATPWVPIYSKRSRALRCRDQRPRFRLVAASRSLPSTRHRPPPAR